MISSIVLDAVIMICVIAFLVFIISVYIAIPTITRKRAYKQFGKREW